MCNCLKLHVKNNETMTMFQILIIRIYFLSIFSSLFVALWGSCMGLMRVNQVLLNSLSKEGNSELKESKQCSFFPS